MGHIFAALMLSVGRLAIEKGRMNKVMAPNEKPAAGRIRVAAMAISGGSPATVFSLLKDGSTWPEWAIFDSFELERPGRDEPYGIGAIRVFITKVSRAREEVVELIPNRRLSYVLLSGFPFRDYRAEVDIEGTESGGSSIAWRLLRRKAFRDRMVLAPIHDARADNAGCTAGFSRRTPDDFTMSGPARASPKPQLRPLFCFFRLDGAVARWRMGVERRQQASG
jgi:hypothetical protein